MNHAPLSPPDHPARLAGFTLIELMVTISILALLLGIGVPAITGFVADNRVKAAAADLQSALMQARAEAIKTNSAGGSVILKPGTGGWQDGWALEVKSVDLDGVASTDIVLTGSPLKSVTISANVSSVEYRPSGRLKGSTSPAFSVSASNTDEKRCVRIALSGQPSIKKGAC